jgi:hypothetical protein
MRRALALIAGPLFAGGSASAYDACGIPPDRSLCGELGPLVPWHKDAIHAGLAWSGDKKKQPKIGFWMRPSEYQGIHSVDPSKVDDDSSSAPFLNAALRPKFETFVFGREFTPGKGFSFSTGPHGLDESVATRIEADLPLDNTLCVDLTHPDVFKNSGKFNIADLTDADFDLNRRAFSNAGHSRGLNFNLFCAAQVALSTGEWIVAGGHDKAGNNGIRKINIFNPATQRWIARGMPEVKAKYLADPEIANPVDHPDPNDERNTDPSHPSDMTYQRWYPTAIHLPNDKVLILSGTDQDSSLVNQGGECASATHSPSCSKHRLNAPEIYDRKVDRTVALENARKLLMMYPIGYVVQTGPGKDDWKVAVIGEADHAAGGPFAGDFSDQAKGINISGYDPWPYSGKTYLFDVRAAEKDPSRGIADNSGKYWELVDTAAVAHESGASSMLVKLDDKGQPVSQKLVLLGGGCGASTAPCSGNTVEMIDFQLPHPRWVAQPGLAQEASQQQGVALPDGTVLVTGGVRGRANRTGTSGWTNSFHYQLFDPHAGTVRSLIETNNPWHDHATMVLLPDGSVINMGGNRTDKVYFTASTCPVGQQCSTQQTRDDGAPVAQVFKPPYFFKGERPVIEQIAPLRDITYEQRFFVSATKASGKIRSVAIVQQHPVTHNHQWNRHVDLWFGEETGGRLIVQAPRFAGVAPPGNYLLFVINERGVPSKGELIHLRAAPAGG